MSERLYTAREMAEHFKVGVHTIRKWGHSGVLKQVKFGRTVRYYMPESETITEE